MKRLIACMMAFIMLLSLAACGKEAPAPTEGLTAPPTESATQPVRDGSDSLAVFREAMPDVVMAAADFGFPELSEEFGIKEYLLDEYPDWMASHLFIEKIPEAQIIQTCDYESWGELFCFVPKDPYATICVKAIHYTDAEPYEELKTEELYRSEGGEPILLLADITEANRISVTVTDSNGQSASFSPYWDYFEDEEISKVVMDFTPVSEKTAYDNALDYGWIVPDESFLTDHFWHSDYGYELELCYNPGQVYDGEAYIYSNNGYGLYLPAYEGYWSYASGFLTLKMDHVEEIPVEFEGSFPILVDPSGEGWLGLFRTEDGTGIPQFEDYMEYDELWPISDGPLDPYKYARYMGWEEPEPEALMNTGWHSTNNGTYAMDLMDDSVPGDNAGYVTIYDVDENGAYTQSYTGTWDYAEGMLHLMLVPEFGDGIFVDDSFPVLMLDDYLWISRNDDGIALPHFYADQLEDILDQPKG